MLALPAPILIVDTGSGVIVSNEGNADLCQVNADTHIVITGIEKVCQASKMLTLYYVY